MSAWEPAIIAAITGGIPALIGLGIYIAKTSYDTRRISRETKATGEATRVETAEIKEETAVIHEKVNSRTDRLDANIQALNTKVVELTGYQGELLQFIRSLKHDLATARGEKPPPANAPPPGDAP